MPVFVIVDLDIHDEELFREYVAGHVPTIEKWGGRVLVGGVVPAVLEGDWSPKRIAVHVWPDPERLKAWAQSDDYRPWRDLRHRAANTNVISVEGLPTSLQVVSGRAITAKPDAYSRLAVGALAVGAMACGALAIGALAISRLAVKRASVRQMHIEDLHIGRLHVEKQQIAEYE